MTCRRNVAIDLSVILAIGFILWFAFDQPALVYFVVRGVHLALHPAPPRCKERGDAFQAKVALIRREAEDSLKVGTRKDAIVRFFASENISLNFDQIGARQEAIGTVYLKGLPECENMACGDDSALIGVRVNIDADGTVLSDPVVTGMYTNCL